MYYESDLALAIQNVLSLIDLDSQIKIWKLKVAVFATTREPDKSVFNSRKRFPCNHGDCKYKFASEKALKEHQTKDHPKENYCCNLCNIVVADESNLSSHSQVRDREELFKKGEIFNEAFIVEESLLNIWSEINDPVSQKIAFVYLFLDGRINPRLWQMS
uniref:C2H2-type domain-containing protein n=1 Tax=Rhabditophanes sp. KR3021 TaxID=114890 RepID=A0AC35TNQ0_9BILA